MMVLMSDVYNCQSFLACLLMLLHMLGLGSGFQSKDQENRHQVNDTWCMVSPLLEQTTENDCHQHEIITRLPKTGGVLIVTNNVYHDHDVI